MIFSRTQINLALALSLQWILSSCDQLPSDAPEAHENKNEAVEKHEPIVFNRDIRPILSENCWGCHGADLHEAEADYSLVNLAQAQKETDSGRQGVKPGSSALSEAWLRIADSEDPMPPVDSHKSLSDAQKQLLKRWIDEGAQYEDHWAYVYPKQIEPVQSAKPEWNQHWIDRFLSNHHQAVQFDPAAETDPATFIRRLHFDVTGLPPSVELVDSYLSDPSTNAREQIVDDLLDSNAFGERLASYWFDLARFADTVGYHGDQMHNASNYRDWVIYAFNQNMPFDQFVQWQLAGDMIEGLDEDAQNDALVASCYNRLIQTTHEGGAQVKEYAAIYDADRVRGVSGAFLGATVGCAQCHDHKFDPFSQKDFYALASFFSDLGDLEHLGKAKNKGKNTELTNRHPEKLLWSPLERERQKSLKQQQAKSSEPAELKSIEEQLSQLKPRLTMVSQSVEPRVVRVLSRGDWQDESGPIVEPAIPAFMGELAADMQVASRATRLDLAKWLTTAKKDGGGGELTARVFVNRMWYLFFGEGLSTSLDDFGGQGEYPNHPELLDNLALDFASDWDVKRLIKMIVSTRAYRMSSLADAEQLKSDPLNTHFSRQGRYRMPAEWIRDNALSVAGILVDKQGGDAAKPYQPEGYFQHLNFPMRSYKSDANENQWKRGVYMHWQRQFLHPMLKAFDAPSREECSARRSRSNTPTAALTMMNDPTFVEAARVLAEITLKQDQLRTDDERVRWMLRRAISRQPSSSDIGPLVELLKLSRLSFAASSAEAEALAGQGSFPVDATLDKTECAAFTQVARAILNLHETAARN